MSSERAPIHTEVDPSTNVYGLDIETDTATDGLDPRVGRVLCAAISGPGGEIVVAHADEAALLLELDGWLHDLRPGVLVTWNGAAFDLPYLATRARHHGVADQLGLRLRVDPDLPLRGDPLPGHEGAYRGAWHGHGHLDAYRLFRADVGRTFGLSCSLKALAALVGLDPVEVDASQVHLVPTPLLHAYVASDARCTRQLVLRRWATASAAIDPVVAPTVAAALEGAIA
jgi:DNA polymerase elongation subunit (family B)